MLHIFPAESVIMNLFARGFEEVTYTQIAELGLMFAQTQGLANQEVLVNVDLSYNELHSMLRYHPYRYSPTKTGIGRGYLANPKSLIQHILREAKIPGGIPMKRALMNLLEDQTSDQLIQECAKYFSMTYVDDIFNHVSPWPEDAVAMTKFQLVLDKFCEKYPPPVRTPA